MIKLVKTIVNERRRLIGFIVEGKDKELQGFSDTKVQKPIPLKVLADSNFANNQIRVNSKGIEEQGNFKINELPMVALVNNTFVAVDSRILLTHRFIQDNEVIGFTVSFSDGTKSNFTYSNTIRLTYWFKPENFSVRTSASGKVYIAGKAGTRLEELPTTNSNESEKAKRTKSAAKDKEGLSTTGQLRNDIDILDIYNFLGDCDGLLLNLPGEKYKSTTNSGVVASNEFTSLGVGEYASPVFEVSENKLNVSIPFKKPGMVQVEFTGGMAMPIQAYTHSTKLLFCNCENYIQRFGVALPKGVEDTFLNNFGKSMSVKEINNESQIKAITALTGKKDLVYYEMETSKIDMIHNDKLQAYILGTKELYDTVTALFTPRAICKYLSPARGLISELKKVVKEDYQSVDGKTPIGLYAGMNDDFKERIKESGIDIYTGAFNKTAKSSKSSVAKDKSGEITIEYAIQGLEINKWTYKKIAEASLAGTGLPSTILSTLGKVNSIKDPMEQMKLAFYILHENEKISKQIKRKLWLHKCAMYLQGNKSVIHQHDKDKWELNTLSKAKAAVYNCTEKGCEGLKVALLNTSI